MRLKYILPHTPDGIVTSNMPQSTKTCRAFSVFYSNFFCIYKVCEVHFYITAAYHNACLSAYCFLLPHHAFFVLISIFIAEHFSVLHFTEIGSQSNSVGSTVTILFSWTFNLGSFLLVKLFSLPALLLRPSQLILTVQLLSHFL